MPAHAKGSRTLWLLRHAKAVTDPPPGGSDFDRVLRPAGPPRRHRARAGSSPGRGEGLGPALKGVPLPQVALVSPAARTAPTAELVLARHGASRPSVRLVDELYGADPEEVLAMLRGLPDDVVAAMVVGHNPTAHALSQGLLRARRQEGALAGGAARLPHLCARRLPLHGRPLGRRGAGAAKLVALLAPPY